ncbi:MAG: DUF6263 family protein [Bacteroidota bacterium]
MKLNRILLVVALLAAFSFQAEAKKVKLQYQLKAGDQFKYGYSISQDITQDLMGQSMTYTVETSFVNDFQVKEVNSDGSFRLTGTLVEYAMNSVTPQGDMKYNSTTDTEIPDFAKIAGLTLNETYFFTLSPLGNITDVVVPDGLQEKIQKAMEGMQDMTGQAMAAAGNNAGSAEGFIKSIMGFFVSFPENPVKPKSKWSVELKVEQMVVFNTATEYTFVAGSKTSNEIKVVSQITQADPSAGMEVQGMNMTYQLSGAKDGNLILDPVTGMIIKGDGVTMISGVISVESSQLPAPMTIPMSVKSTEKISRK